MRAKLGSKRLAEGHRMAMDSTGLALAPQGMRVKGLYQNKRNSSNGITSSQVCRALVKMEDAQVSFWILRLPTISLVSHAPLHDSALTYAPSHRRLRYYDAVGVGFYHTG